MPPADPNLIAHPQRIDALLSLCLLDTPADPAFDRLTALAATILNVPTALVTLVDLDRQFFKSQVGLPSPWSETREMPLSHSYCQHTIVQSTPLIIEDARQHPLVYDNPAIRELNAIAYAGIPLITSSGHAIGSFCVTDTRIRHWTEREIAILTDLAASVMTEIELRAEIRERERAQQRELELLLEQGRILMLRDFIQNISHEFRTPLSIILSNAQIMERLDDAEKRKTRSEQIRGQIARITRLITMMMLMAQLDTPGAPHFEPTSLIRILAALREQVWQGKAALRFDIPSELPLVRGEPHHLEEALRQIIDNAMQHTLSGGSVRVTAGLEGKRVWIDVEDDGVGISAEDMPHIFDRFWRGDRAHSTPGVGLGLSLVQRILEVHDGTIIVESAPGKGTRVRLLLPILTPR